MVMQKQSPISFLTILSTKRAFLLAEMNRLAEIWIFNWTEIQIDRRADYSARRTEH